MRPVNFEYRPGEPDERMSPGEAPSDAAGDEPAGPAPEGDDSAPEEAGYGYGV